MADGQLNKQTLSLAAWLDWLDTVLTRLSSTSRGPDHRLCRLSSLSLFDSNCHAQIDPDPQSLLSCAAFVETLCLWLGGEKKISPASFYTSSSLV